MKSFIGVAVIIAVTTCVCAFSDCSQCPKCPVACKDTCKCGDTCKCESVRLSAVQTDVVGSYVSVTKHGDIIGAAVQVDIRGEKLILTCAHCVRGQTIAYVRTEDDLPGTRADIECTVISYDKDADLALLKPASIKHCNSTWVKLDGKVKPRPGESAVGIGSRYGVYGILETTFVCRPSIMVEGELLTALNGNAWHGDSGGGVFVYRAGSYKLIGLICRGIEEHERTPSCAIHEDTIYNFIGK